MFLPPSPKGVFSFQLVIYGIKPHDTFLEVITRHVFASKSKMSYFYSNLLFMALSPHDKCILSVQDFNVSYSFKVIETIVDF